MKRTSKILSRLTVKGRSSWFNDFLRNWMCIYTLFVRLVWRVWEMPSEHKKKSEIWIYFIQHILFFCYSHSTAAHLMKEIKKKVAKFVFHHVFMLQQQHRHKLPERERVRGKNNKQHSVALHFLFDVLCHPCDRFLFRQKREFKLEQI